MAIASHGWPAMPIGLGLLVVAMSWTSGARAEEKARLVYVRGAGAEECPAEVNLRLLVMARLSYDPFSPQASRVVLSRIERNGQQLAGSVEVVDQGGMATGQRELTAQVGHCPELARALALSISLAIDPERASQPAPSPPLAPSPEKRSEPPPPSPSPQPLPGRARAAAARGDRPKPRAFLGVAVAGSVGALPGPALGGALSLGWRVGAGSVALEGLLQQAISSDLAPRGALTGALFLGGASACWLRGVWTVCGLAVAGAQRLGTSGVTHPVTSHGLFWGAGPRVAWLWTLTPRWQAVTSVEGLVNFHRNGAELSGREVWRAPPVSADLSVGVRTSFL